SAADKPVEEKAAKKENRAAKGPQFLPYKEMASLSDEQKAQIVEVHQKYLAERKKLEEAERAEIEALLTPEQIEEAKQIQEKRAAQRKSREAERKAAKEASGTE